MNDKNRKIEFLYTNIGRGHPFYLDGIIDALIRRGAIKIMRGESNVFELSTGLARLGWKTADWFYKRGSSSGFLGVLYNFVRAGYDYDRPGLMLKFMGRDIYKKFLASPHPLLVAHPILAGILKNKKALIYQHGEVVAPAAALVTGLSKILVPTAEIAQVFKKAGYEEQAVFVSGLCIEPALVKIAGDCYEARLKRLTGQEPLTGAFFSSGAEPKMHIKKLAAAAVSAVHYGGQAVIFARYEGCLARETEKLFKRNQLILPILDTGSLIPSELPPALLVTYRTRREENIFTAKLFKYFDYFVAPAHERTNWALGLGLPVMIVEPAIGPFAPLNREKLLQSGVAELLKDEDQALMFGLTINRLRRENRLLERARAGWGNFDIKGFDNIAGFLVETYGSR